MSPAPATEADRRRLREAIELSRRCPPSDTAYSVGAIIVAGDGTQLAAGYSRDVDPRVHAEESALAALAGSGWGGADPADATIYSSLEPCSSRRSRPRTCTQLILAAGIGRVVFALHEPPLLADCHGAELLREGGVEVVEIADMAQLVQDVNAHLFPPGGRDG